MQRLQNEVGISCYCFTYQLWYFLLTKHPQDKEFCRTCKCERFQFVSGIVAVQVCKKFDKARMLIN